MGRGGSFSLGLALSILRVVTLSNEAVGGTVCLVLIGDFSVSDLSFWAEVSLLVVDSDPLTGKNVRIVLKSSPETFLNFDALIFLPGGALFLFTSYSEAKESFHIHSLQVALL